MLWMHGERMRIAIVCSIVLLVSGRPPGALAEDSGGRLQTIRDAVRASPAPSNDEEEDDDEDERRRRRNACYNDGWRNNDDGSNNDTNIFVAAGALALCIAAIPVWTPISLAFMDYSEPGSFLLHPYADGQPGYRMAPIDEFTPLDRQSAPTWPWASRVRVEYADGYGGLSRIGGRALFENEAGSAVEASLDAWTEKLHRGGEDEFLLGNVNFLYRLIDAPNMPNRFGVGLNWLADDFGADFGVNFTYQIDLFVARPWIWSTAMDVGSLGSTGLFRARSTVGYCVGGAELYGGYDYLHLGWKGEGASMGGFVAGLQFWH
jgi:hypothetical protein